jgi:hypothetical protein
VVYHNLEWRLGMVTGNRSRHNIMVPKYTCKLDLKAAITSDNRAGAEGNNDLLGMETVIFDADYANLKLL